MAQLILLPQEEYAVRIDTIRTAISNAGMDAILVTDNANIYYITGRVFTGYIYIPVTGQPILFVRRPIDLEGDGVVYIHKPELISQSLGLNVPATLGLELDLIPYTFYQRLQNVFPQSDIVNASPIMRGARACKTGYELKKMAISGMKQERVYRRIPHLYQEGMTDLELQVEIERTARLEGCLGQFRISGDSMELFMGNVLTGDNADIPTPYDFAMGGEGLDPSLPVGSNGTVIREGLSVMVDVNGNFTGYMTDMTRTFSLGSLSPLAMRAHNLSVDICRAIASVAGPGTAAKDLFHIAEDMAKKADLHHYFMGHRQKAGFVGHGLGIEVNEQPVIAPRSHDILSEGNAIALEPKFVIPHVGAVGIENTYVVHSGKGLQCITNAPENIISLI